MQELIRRWFHGELLKNVICFHTNGYAFGLTSILRHCGVP